jgi:hypothetical protein
LARTRAYSESNSYLPAAAELAMQISTVAFTEDTGDFFTEHHLS